MLQTRGRLATSAVGAVRAVSELSTREVASSVRAAALTDEATSLVLNSLTALTAPTAEVASLPRVCNIAEHDRLGGVGQGYKRRKVEEVAERQ